MEFLVSFLYLTMTSHLVTVVTVLPTIKAQSKVGKLMFNVA